MPGMSWKRSKASNSERGDKRAFWVDRKACAKALWPREERVQSVLETKRKPVWLEQKDAPWRAGVGLCPGEVSAAGTRQTRSHTRIYSQ